MHDLSVLTQNTERRGSLVSRVTSDVDTISLFVQWGGIMLLVSVLQIAVATVLMAVYSWQLTLIVWAGFVPLFVLLQPLQKRVNARYTAVRERVGGMLGAISEAVVGAETIRAYGVAERTQRRIDAAVAATRARDGAGAEPGRPRVLQRRARREPRPRRSWSSPGPTWASRAR